MGFLKNIFSKKKTAQAVDCDDARKTVLLTGGMRIVCPDDDESEKDAAHIVVKPVGGDNADH